MIPKGNQRGGGRQLATHLLNQYDNERVELLDLRGAVAHDLHGAFAEWQAQSNATRCRKYLYSLSINPDHRQLEVEARHYLDYVGRVEERLGLAGQPRAIVMHVKNGREHCHVVWSRINVERERAVQISHDRQKLRAITQDYAREYGLELPDGAARDGSKERFDKQRKRENLAEKGQEKRTGLSKEERQTAIQEAWRESDSGKAFVQALAERGYYLAQGEERGENRTARFVVVDMYGDVHSLARQLSIKAAALRDRLKDVDAQAVQTIEGAQVQAKARLEARQQEESKAEAQARDKTWQETLEREQAERGRALEEETATLSQRHESERAELAELQAGRDEDQAQAKQRSFGRVGAFLQRITGIQKWREVRQQRQDAERAKDLDAQLQALEQRQAMERQDLDRRRRDLETIQKRERASLSTDQQRAALPPMPGQTKQPDLTIQAFAAAAAKPAPQQELERPAPQAEFTKATALSPDRAVERSHELSLRSAFSACRAYIGGLASRFRREPPREQSVTATASAFNRSANLPQDAGAAALKSQYAEQAARRDQASTRDQGHERTRDLGPAP